MWKTIFLGFLIYGIAVSATELKVLILKDGSSPYAENASGDILSTFNKAVLGQLLTISPTFELKPGLLKDWKSHADGTYELFLREDLSFHDNSSVTAEDLEFSLLRGFFSEQRSFYEIYLGNILGVEKITPGTPYKSGLVEGVKITGPYSLKIKLRDLNPAFLYSLTAPYFSLSKKDAFKKDLIRWSKWPIGAGPYKVDTEDEYSVTLKKTSKSKNSVDKILLFKKDNPQINYDISFFPTKQSMKDFSTKDPSAIYTLFFTNQNELSLQSNFRKAVKFGTDRKELTKGDKYSKPSYEFLTSNFWKNDKSIETQYDLKKAKIYFSKVPKNLQDKTWRIPVFSFGELSAEKKRITSILQKQFFKFGLKVEFYPNSSKFLKKTEAEASPMAFSGRVCDNVDPLLMFSSFKSKSAYKYDNSQLDPKYDALFEKAAKASSTEERISTLRALSKYTIDNNFMLPLYENLQTYLYNPRTVKSFGNQINPISLSLEEIKMESNEK